MATNRPHFHIWQEARTGRIFYRLARPFHTRQAANQYGKRRNPDDPEKFMVRQCNSEKCKPKID